MTDIAGISGSHRLTSKPKVSLEGNKVEPKSETSSLGDVQQLEVKMAQFEQAFKLVQEIRHSLETALRNLSQ